MSFGSFKLNKVCFKDQFQYLDLEPSITTYTLTILIIYNSSCYNLKV